MENEMTPMKSAWERAVEAWPEMNRSEQAAFILWHSSGLEFTPDERASLDSILAAADERRKLRIDGDITRDVDFPRAVRLLKE